MPGRKYTAPDSKYRFGFNGKENDDEGMGGGGATYDYGFRIYNPQLGRFLSVDPLTNTYPYYTPYQFAGNNPILFIDLYGYGPQEEGKENEVTVDKGQTVTSIATSTGTDDVLQTIKDIISLNGLSKDGHIEPGDKLKLPSSVCGAQSSQSSSSPPKEESVMKLLSKTFNITTNGEGFDLNSFKFVKTEEGIDVYSNIDIVIKDGDFSLNIAPGDRLKTLLDNTFSNLENGTVISTKYLENKYNSTGGALSSVSKNTNTQLGFGVSHVMNFVVDQANNGNAFQVTSSEKISNAHYVLMITGMQQGSAKELFFKRFGKHYKDSVDVFIKNKAWIDNNDSGGYDMSR